MSAATPCAHLCVAERGSVHLARRELMVLNAFVGGRVGAALLEILLASASIGSLWSKDWSETIGEVS